VYAPEEDPEMTVEHYERSFEQNEYLGLNDMKTENYTDKDSWVMQRASSNPCKSCDYYVCKNAVTKQADTACVWWLKMTVSILQKLNIVLKVFSVDFLVIPDLVAYVFVTNIALY